LGASYIKGASYKSISTVVDGLTLVLGERCPTVDLQHLRSHLRKFLVFCFLHLPTLVMGVIPHQTTHVERPYNV